MMVSTMEKYRKLEYGSFSDFKGRSFSNNVLTLNVTSWDEFHKVVEIFKPYPDYVWRGQRRFGGEWKLNSSFDRMDKFKSINSEERRIELNKILDNFKCRLKDLPDSEIDCFSDDEIWAIGQHHGLPTPLLDWTEDPYIAAYMAFFKKGEKEIKENRAVYALNRVLKRLIAKRKDSKSGEVLSSDPFVEFPDLKHIIDSRQNARLAKQRGKFTRALNGYDIKSNVERLSRKGLYNEKIILAEILIPGKFRDECLECLKSMSITHGTLFPDYAGAVDICRMELGMDESK